jgi:hypothetical protein
VFNEKEEAKKRARGPISNSLKILIEHWIQVKYKEYDMYLFDYERLNVGDSYNIVEKWIIWDQTVEEEIGFLIDNAYKHSKDIGKYLMLNSKETNKHSVWITVKYASDFSTLSFHIYNKSLHNAEYICEASAKKTRYGKSRLSEELGVKVEYHDFQKERDCYIIETKVIFNLI